MDHKLSPRMRTYYYLIIAIIVFLSIAAMGGMLFFLDSGVGLRLSVSILISLLAVVSVFTALMSYFLGRRILAPMVKLSQASREVARGNFNVSVSDSSRLEEVQTTFRNFNAMVRELGGVATLSNDFISNVSHEFKTPLSAMEGYAMLLQDPTLTQAERDDCAQRILYNTRRLSDLVGNILMLSKMENKGLAEEYHSFRLDEQLRQVAVAMEPEWSARELWVDAALDEVSFYGCESLLHHVWSNLLSNAIKFSPPGGRIGLSLLSQKECVVVSVTDEGCGMSQEVQQRIFEKFYQGDASHRSEGNGLGLPLAKRIVELSEGVIEVQSAPGSGSTFRVILPK